MSAAVDPEGHRRRQVTGLEHRLPPVGMIRAHAVDPPRRIVPGGLGVGRQRRDQRVAFAQETAQGRVEECRSGPRGGVTTRGLDRLVDQHCLVPPAGLEQLRQRHQLQGGKGRRRRTLVQNPGKCEAGAEAARGLERDVLHGRPRRRGQPRHGTGLVDRGRQRAATAHRLHRSGRGAQFDGERGPDPALRFAGAQRPAIAIRRRIRSSVAGCVEKRPRRPPPDSGFMIIICAVSGWRSVVSSGMPCA